ncbi:MAG: hypothetical protein KKH32_09895 [Bacteroidetes bacterium]|nr:hypothetical protein [Bacteroidota bacterium]
MINFSVSVSQNKNMFHYGGKIIEYTANFESDLSQNHPTQFLDSVFVYALKLSEGDVADALLFCSVGTVPYSEFEMTIPLINIPIKVFIFNIVNEDIFNRMIRNLPTKIFADSPEGTFGDKDKVTHFFSSAYWSYSINENFANAIGHLVEHFEEGFKVQSVVDERDLTVNQLGIKFGSLLKDRLHFPSEIISNNKSLTYGKNSNN